MSCQAEGEDPFNSVDGINMMVRAAIMGGASAIRCEGVDNVKSVINRIPVPLIGLIKGTFPDNTVCITGTFKEVECLVQAGCRNIAVDGTFRMREGISGPEYIRKLKEMFDITIIADISEVEEGCECFGAGADIVSTTLSGYTPSTMHLNKGLPNFELVEELIAITGRPVLAEGRISTPDQALQMILLGAHAVTVGTFITRPRIITRVFAKTIEEKKVTYDY